MQGKDKQGFDKVFIDKQWSQMESLLNDRLPQDKKKSNHKPLLIILSLLLLLTTLSTAYFAYKFNTSIPVTDLIKEKIIYKNVYIETPIAAPVPSSTTQGITTQKQTLLHTKRHKVAEQSTTSTDKTATPLQKETALTGIVTNQIMLDNISTLPALASEINTTDIVESGLFFGNDILINDASKSKRKTQFKIGILASSTMDLDYTGMGITTGVSFPISKKLSFNTGLALNYLDRDHLFIPDFIRGTDETLLDPKNPQTYYEGLRNLKQVYVPMALSFNLTKAWAINSGLKFRYTYSETVNEDLPLPPARPSRNPVENHESLFNKANIGVTAGLEFNVNPSFSILLDSEWGMSSIINRSQFTTTGSKYDLNVINLSTSYNF